MKNNIVKDKSEYFAIQVITMYKHLCDVKKEFILSKQLLRSGTSIGANIVESEYAISKKDFVSKLHIALKECAETIYWLKLLYATNYITEFEHEKMSSFCEELRKILSSIIISSKTAIKNEK